LLALSDGTSSPESELARLPFLEAEADDMDHFLLWNETASRAKSKGGKIFPPLPLTVTNGASMFFLQIAKSISYLYPFSDKHNIAIRLLQIFF
jgi:hypothetical protein